ncbi:MAG: hypothetical protein KGI68_15055 [Alphaproteobacteria bacterium]|nr:hypothetical protein [Alphaproteobacteria bacterium]
MSMDNALAAGQGGMEAAPQSQTLAHENQPNTPLARRPEDGPQQQDNDETPDRDDPRRHTVDRLSKHLDINLDLAGLCRHLAAVPKKGRSEAVFAAARLTQANAQLARAMAELLQVERRHRTIIERIQTPAPVFGHSNLNEQDTLIDSLTAKMLRYLNFYAADVFDPVLKKAEEDACAKEASAPAAAPAA